MAPESEMQYTRAPSIDVKRMMVKSSLFTMIPKVADTVPMTGFAPVPMAQISDPDKTPSSSEDSTSFVTRASPIAMMGGRIDSHPAA